MNGGRWILAVVATATLAACGREPGPPPAEQAPATPVRAVPVESVGAASRVRAVGVLAPRDELRLAFKVGGVVDRVAVEAGDRVHRGQLLATLDRTEVEAALAQARESAEKARRDLERGRRLRADEVATEEQVQDLATAYGVARANLAAAAFNSRFARIEAPAEGLVLQRLVEENELVQGGQPVLVLGATGTGWVVRTSLADRDAVRVEVGSPVELRFDAFPGRRFDGRVSRIASAADPATGTFEIEVDVAATGERFARGLIARLAFALRGAGGDDELAVVPVAALVEASGADATVYVLDAAAGVARRKQVQVGAIVGDRVVVVAGLAPGEQVITDGAAWLRDGRAVRLVADPG